ncbi:hypothetical protein WK11_11420 [Burkholderia ubonensis]|uniref:hypothetical protein n=1 Tax=Burkholderia ubonensis TaxID=101571 RepID=UPI0007563980|nr:hypothetical protein [Burkholderia ubonensis]KVN91894.1 hypothetical protein WJ69_10730 [Burkholderia ubonensis]KVN95448.1 hypothetical protein WJ71_31925 [Burkholderia ubonensis]KVO27167.1 hypothetical protein WJ72_22650 [Burkholderia ubonensis]KVO33164.1 hypothetical protein WJ74_19040 [Burkholderia ubonensis]KVQ73425.1 hypothetical protein WK05_12285 [Burkholderia ubonensis]
MTNHADVQRAMVRSILNEAMAILRDDKPFDPSNTVFGRIIDTESHYRSEGRRYLYASPVSPSSTVAFSTFDDPEDYSADRSKVKIVPTGLIMRLSPMLADMPHSEIESLLQLDNYWVDSNGNRHHENEIPGRHPQTPNLQSFHYRNKDTPNSKFPVNVELFYANPLDGSFPPMLSKVVIRRAYKILTPEERRERRLEERQAKRQKYGEMNLRTGMLCPETGLWQGYVHGSSACRFVIREGQRFPVVRTLTPSEELEQRRRSEFLAGQWMWVRGEYDDPAWSMKDPEFDA